MTAELSAFLRRSLRQPFIWGQRDCGLWAASWVFEARGTDPAASVRGAYQTAAGCRALVRRHGGLAAFASDLLRDAGFAETEDPQPGDVGVIDTPAGPAVVIRTSRGWAWKNARGISVVAAPALAAWRI